MSAITAHEAHAPSPDYAHAAEHSLGHGSMGFVRKYIFSFDHKVIGIQFLFSTLLWFVVGGLLALARGDNDGAIRALERSLAEEGGTYPLERGRTLIALGVTHRHARRIRAAREVLNAAVDLLGEIGAVAWRDRAIAELGRLSGRGLDRGAIPAPRSFRRCAWRYGSAWRRTRSPSGSTSSTPSS